MRRIPLFQTGLCHKKEGDYFVYKGNPGPKDLQYPSYVQRSFSARKTVEQNEC